MFKVGKWLVFGVLLAGCGGAQENLARTSGHTMYRGTAKIPGAGLSTVRVILGPRPYLSVTSFKLPRSPVRAANAQATTTGDEVTVSATLPDIGRVVLAGHVHAAEFYAQMTVGNSTTREVLKQVQPGSRGAKRDGSSFTPGTYQLALGAGGTEVELPIPPATINCTLSNLQQFSDFAYTFDVALAGELPFSDLTLASGIYTDYSSWGLPSLYELNISNPAYVISLDADWYSDGSNPAATYGFNLSTPTDLGTARGSETAAIALQVTAP